MKAGRDHWWHELMGSRRAGLPGRAELDSEHPALYPLHIGDDGKAQGYSSYDRRISDAGTLYTTIVFDLEGRRCLLVYGGYRLGDWSFLCGLWPAGERGDEC